MFEDVLRFWLDRGVDGFRVDVAHGLFKERVLRDQVGAEAGEPARPSTATARWSSGRQGRADVGPARGPRRLPRAGAGSSTSTTATGWPSPRRGPRRPSRLARYVRPDELHQAFNFAWLLAPLVGRRLRATSSTGTLDAARAGRRAADLGAVQPRRRPARDPVRRRRGRRWPGPAPRRWRCWRCPARRTSTRARSSACERSTSPRRTGRTRRGSAPASVGRDGCRVPMPWSGDARAVRLRPGRRAAVAARSPTTGRRSPSRRRTATRRRRWSSTARRSRRGATLASTAGDEVEIARPRRATCWRSAAARSRSCSTAATAPVAAARRARCWSPAARLDGRQAAAGHRRLAALTALRLRPSGRSRRAPRCSGPSVATKPSSSSSVQSPSRSSSHLRGARRTSVEPALRPSSLADDQHRAAVVGVGRALDQAEVDEVLDLAADRALVDAELLDDRRGRAAGRPRRGG